jgi:hypothetical protein
MSNGLGHADELSSESTSGQHISTQGQFATSMSSFIEEGDSSRSLPNSLEAKSKRYCYFERATECPSRLNECCVDGRACASNRGYLDHIYGSHHFPHIAKTKIPTVSRRNSRSSDITQPVQLPIDRPATSSPSSHDSPFPKAVDSTVDKNVKRHSLSSSLLWIESATVGVIRVVFNVAVAVISILFVRPQRNNSSGHDALRRDVNDTNN